MGLVCDVFPVVDPEFVEPVLLEPELVEPALFEPPLFEFGLLEVVPAFAVGGAVSVEATQFWVLLGAPDVVPVAEPDPCA